MFFACAPATLDYERFNAALFCFAQAVGIRLIADYHCDLGVWNPILTNSVR